jgi:hypothetical protein
MKSSENPLLSELTSSAKFGSEGTKAISADL